MRESERERALHTQTRIERHTHTRTHTQGSYHTDHLFGMYARICAALPKSPTTKPIDTERFDEEEYDSDDSEFEQYKCVCVLVLLELCVARAMCQCLAHVCECASPVSLYSKYTRSSESLYHDTTSSSYPPTGMPKMRGSKARLRLY